MDMQLDFEVLDDVAQRAKDNALAHEEPELAKTIDRALKLLKSRPLRFDDRNLVLVVPGSKGQLYEADARPGGSCQCFYFSNTRRACLHRVAAKLLKRYFEIVSLKLRDKRRAEQRDRDNAPLVKKSHAETKIDGFSI